MTRPDASVLRGDRLLAAGVATLLWPPVLHQGGSWAMLLAAVAALGTSTLVGRHERSEPLPRAGRSLLGACLLCGATHTWGLPWWTATGWAVLPAIPGVCHTINRYTTLWLLLAILPMVLAPGPIAPWSLWSGGGGWDWIGPAILTGALLGGALPLSAGLSRVAGPGILFLLWLSYGLARSVEGQAVDTSDLALQGPLWGLPLAAAGLALLPAPRAPRDTGWLIGGLGLLALGGATVPTWAIGVVLPLVLARRWSRVPSSPLLRAAAWGAGALVAVSAAPDLPSDQTLAIRLALVATVAILAVDPRRWSHSEEAR